MKNIFGLLGDGLMKYILIYDVLFPFPSFNTSLRERIPICQSVFVGVNCRIFISQKNISIIY